MPQLSRRGRAERPQAHRPLPGMRPSPGDLGRPERGRRLATPLRKAASRDDEKAFGI